LRGEGWGEGKIDQLSFIGSRHDARGHPSAHDGFDLFSLLRFLPPEALGLSPQSMVY